MKRKIVWLISSSLVVVTLSLISCTPSVTKEEESVIEKENATQEENYAYLEIKTSIGGWITSNADNLSQEIAALLPEELEMAQGVVAKVIKTALLTELKLSVQHVVPIEGEDRYSARVTLGFPILLELPLLGRKEYWVSIGCEFIIESGQVVEAHIDIPSFEMTSL